MWGPGAQGGFQNALAMGLQVGQMVRQGQDKREYKNALAQFDPSNPETLKPIMAANPEMGVRLQGEITKRQEMEAAAREADIKRRAAAGQPEAVAELAGIDFNAWRGLNSDQQKELDEGFDAMGQAGLFVASLPPEQRPAAWDQQVELLAQRFPAVAQYRGQYSEAGLQSVIAQAGQFDQFRQLTKPESFNVGPGEGRYERDPRTGQITTVVQPNYGQAPSFSPVPGNTPAPVAEKSIGGTTYVQDANGDWYVKGGGGSNVTGGFQGP